MARDRDLDVAAVRWDGARNLADILVWRFGPDGRPGSPATISTGTLTVDIAFGDVDGDGDADLVTVGYGKSQLKDPNQPMAEANRRVQVVNMENKATASK